MDKDIQKFWEEQKEQPVFTKPITKREELKKIRDLQGQNGNWDCDEYSLGLYNGLELACAIIEGREPVYRKLEVKE